VKRFVVTFGMTFFFLVNFALFHMRTDAQSGTITGRINYEDGGSAANVTVMLSSLRAYQQPANSRGSGDRTVTDEEGNFKFTGVAPGIYLLNVLESKGYVRPASFSPEAQEQQYCRVGDAVTITMVKGGVITGRVTAANGEPMVGVRVYPLLVRDAEGSPLKRMGGGRARMTDDRGVYRLYGLAPGSYVVYTRPETFGPTVSPYEGNIPTYHPSSTRDTAGEIAVTTGGEATGVDIHYRGERGRVVSGTFAGVGESSSPFQGGVGVTLTSVSTGNFYSGGGVRVGENANAFAIYGVPDGEYEIVARRMDVGIVEASASTPRRVTVKGADVTGIELRLAPMSSISGKIILDAPPRPCENTRKSSVEEVALRAYHDGVAGANADFFNSMVSNVAPNEKGEFRILNLQDGRYHVEPRMPNEVWYLKSVTSTAPPAASGSPRGTTRSATPVDVSRNGIMLKTGEKVTGLTMTVADGGASLRGKVVAPDESTRLPTRLRIFLVPSENDAGDAVLRYAETTARGDRSFAFGNLAPGKYWLLARPVAEEEPVDRPPTPLAWDANERAKLRREAMAMKNEVELQPCGRENGYVLRFKR
jgi:hypothetical protein